MSTRKFSPGVEAYLPSTVPGAAADKAIRDERVEFNAQRDRLQERLDQFESYGITINSALRDREEVEQLTKCRDEALTLLESAIGYLAHNWTDVDGGLDRVVREAEKLIEEWRAYGE